MLLAVKARRTDLKTALNAARGVRIDERNSEKGKTMRAALLVEVKRYLQRHRSLDPTSVANIVYPVGNGFPAFTQDGSLPPGFWHISLTELVETLAFNRHRQAQLKLLFEALTELKNAGCKKVTIAGSFASAKPKPQDIDMIWDIEGLDQTKLDPIFSQENGTPRQQRFGIDSVGSDEEWKLRLSMVQSLWGANSPKPNELSEQEMENLPRFRAVGVLVLDLTADFPALMG